MTVALELLTGVAGTLVAGGRLRPVGLAAGAEGETLEEALTPRSPGGVTRTATGAG
jgi:hypothetical protein